MFFLHEFKGLKGLSKLGTSLNLFDSFKSTENFFVSLVSKSFFSSTKKLSMMFEGTSGAKYAKFLYSFYSCKAKKYDLILSFNLYKKICTDKDFY